MKEINERWVSTVIIPAALFVDMLVYGLVLPIIPTYSVRLGISFGAVGLVFASYGVALLGATPVVGRLIAGRVSPRTMLLGGFVALAISSLVFAASTTFAGLVGARLVQGAAAAASWTAGLAMIAENFEGRQRGHAFALATSASALGTLLGPPVGGWLADAWGYRAPFFGVALLSLVLATAGAIGLKRSRAPREPTRTRPGLMLADRQVRALCAFVFLGAVVLGVLEPTLPLDLSTRMLASKSDIGLLFAAATLTYGASSPLVGWATSKVGPSHLIRTGWLCTATTLPLLTLPTTISSQLAFMSMLGVGLAMIQGPSLRALASAVERVGGDYGIAYAAYNAAYAVGIIVGAGLGACLVEALGTFKGLMIASCALLVAGVHPALRLGRAR